MISVIMLTFNRQNYIKNMIEDILSQTYTDFEYIIVDNGSFDQSGQVADEYAQTDHRMRVRHLKKPYSIGYGRNCGLDLSQGEYITFVDDDDRVKSHYLETLWSMIETHQADIAVCGIEEKRGEQVFPQCVYKEKYILSGEEAVVELLKREKIRSGLPTKLIKRELFEKIRFDENVKSEDARISYELFSEASKVVMEGIPLYCAVRHLDNNSAFTNDSSKLTFSILNEYIETYELRRKYLLKRFPEREQFWNYVIWSFFISMCGKVHAYHIQECMGLYYDMREQLIQNKEKILRNPYLKEYEAKQLFEIVGEENEERKG